MSLMRHVRTRVSNTCNRQQSTSEDSSAYCAKRGNNTRSFGHARRSFGQVNLKVDPSQYLLPMNEEFINIDEFALQKFKFNLSDLAASKKGCIVMYTLEYFDKSSQVSPFVDTLIETCLLQEHIMETTTRNFLLLSNMKTYGERIKIVMLNSLKHIHEDILYFGGTNSSISNSHCLPNSYDHDSIISYYKFTSLLYFRFRRHLDFYGRYKSLASLALSALQYLVGQDSIESLTLFTHLVQLNLHSLTEWYDEEVKLIVLRAKRFVYLYKSKQEQIKWGWMSVALRIINRGPVFELPLYNRYEKVFGPVWSKTVVHPPVQILDVMNEYVVEEKQESFLINDDDIRRNMFVDLS